MADEFLVTDFGTLHCPEFLMPPARRRKDGQPDLRYKAGKEWRSRFKEFLQAQQKAWVAGDEVYQAWLASNGIREPA